MGDYRQELDHGSPRRLFAEAKLEDLMKNRVADLFAEAVILANILGVDLQEAYPDRIHRIELEKLNPLTQE